MATNRKLGKTTDIRLAMLKTLTTDLMLHEKIETTEARAKEVKAIADSLISLAVKEKDNFEMVDVKVSKAKLDEKEHTHPENHLDIFYSNGNTFKIGIESMLKTTDFEDFFDTSTNCKYLKSYR